MLVLSRKDGQTIYIQAGGRIVRVMLGETRRGRARVYVDAPADVVVVREELLDRYPLEGVTAPKEESDG